MPRLEDDRAPRLLLTVLPDDRCPGALVFRCDQPRVRGFPTPGLLAALPPGTDLVGPFCLNRRCPRALGALGPLRALEQALRVL